MNDNTAAIIIEGDASPFRQAMQDMARASQDGTAAVKVHFDRLGSAFKDMQDRLKAVAGHAAEAVRVEWQGVAEDLKAEMAQFREAAQQAFADAKQQAATAFEKMKEDARSAVEEIQNHLKVLSIAAGVVFSVLGLGALYAAVRAVTSAVEFVVGLATGSSYKSESIEKLNQTIAALKPLRQELGLSANGALALGDAMRRLGVDQDSYIAVVNATRSAAQNNGDELDRLGVKYKDANGNLLSTRDFLQNVKARLDEYTAGWDRNQAAAAMGVGSYEAVTAALKVTDDQVAQSRERLNDYNLGIGPETEAAVEHFQAAMREFNNELKLTSDGFSRAFADQIMPLLTDFAEWFRDGWPFIVNATRYAMAQITSLFYGLKEVVQLVYEGIRLALQGTGNLLMGLGLAAVRALKGDLSGAGEALRESWNKTRADMNATGERIVADARKNAAAMRLAWGFDDRAAPQPNDRKAVGGKPWTPKPAPPATERPERAERQPADPSLMAYYEAALSEEKRLSAERDALREYTKQEELAFWQTLLQYADLNSKDRVAIEKKTSDLVVAIKREEAKQQEALTAETIRFGESLQNGQLQAKQAAAKLALDLDQITKAQYLQAEEQFENERWEIQKKAMDERMSLLQADPNTNPVEYAKLKNQILELEQAHQLALQNIKGQQAVEGNKGGFFDALGSAFTSGLDAMVRRAETWRQQLFNIFASVRDAFLRETVYKPFQEWIATEGRKIAAKLGFVTQEKALESAGAATTVATKASEATSVVGANAAEAASGAAASQASIPIVGPGLAASAFAATMALAMGAMSNIKSAAGGYDIPRGLNPITQLHQEEVVLPASIAVPLRNMLATGGTPQGSGPGEVRIINSTDPAVIRDWLRGPEGTQIIKNVVTSNPEMIRRTLG